MRSTVAAPIPHHDGLAAHGVLRQSGRGKADHHRIVAGQHQVDRDDLAQGGELRPQIEVFHRSIL